LTRRERSGIIGGTSDRAGVGVPGQRQVELGRRLAALAAAAACGLLLATAAEGRGTTEPIRAGFVVRVLGLEADGAVVPLADAAAGIHPGSTVGTDANGYAFVKAAPSEFPGDKVVIDASKSGYAPEQVELVVDRGDYALAQTNQTLPGRFISWLKGSRSRHRSTRSPPTSQSS